MDESNTRPRNPTFAGLYFSRCFCCGSDGERSIIRPSWLQKVKRSNPRANSVNVDSQNWWRKGWNSIRQAGKWSESVINDAESCSRALKWKRFVGRFKTDGKTICGSKPSRFQYDPVSYELNFDNGPRQDEGYWLQGLPLSVVKTEKSMGTLLDK